MKQIAQYLFYIIQISFFIMGITLLFSNGRNLSALYRYMSREIVMSSHILYRTEDTASYDADLLENTTISRAELMMILITKPEYEIEVDGVLYSPDDYDYQVDSISEDKQKFSKSYERNEDGSIEKVVYSHMD